MSDEWFAFHGPPKVADSLPDNKIVQGLSNFNSFHWLTTIKTTPQDTEMEQKSRHMVLPQAFFCMGYAHTPPSTLFQGRGNSSRTSDLTPAAPKSLAALASHAEKAFCV